LRFGPSIGPKIGFRFLESPMRIQTLKIPVHRQIFLGQQPLMAAANNDLVVLFHDFKGMKHPLKTALFCCGYR